MTHSADPGPVRHLQCHYDRRRLNPLICEWSAPKRPNGRIKYYIVSLIDRKGTISNNTGINTWWQSRHCLKYGGVYGVSVSPVTYAVGPSVTTRVDFISSGKNQNCGDI